MATHEWENTIEIFVELYRQGRYKEAILLAEEALKLALQDFGAEHPTTADILNYLAGLYDELGRHEEAERSYQRALAIREQALPADHSDIAASLNNLAVFYRIQGRHKQAEPLYQRLVETLGRALPPDYPHIAIGLSNLAELYRAQGRYEEGEALCWQALDIWKRASVPDLRSVAGTLTNLAIFHQLRNRYEEAIKLCRRALAIREQVLPPDHPDIAANLNILAALYDHQGRYAESEPFYQGAQAIWEQTLGPHHPDVALVIKNRAEKCFAQGRYEEAEPLHQQALAIWEQALPPDHPNVATGFQNLAKLYHSQDRYKEALKYAQRATSIYRQRTVPASEEQSDAAISERRANRFQFALHLSIIAGLAGQEPERAAALIEEAFDVTQLAVASRTAAAVGHMAARFATGDDRLAHIVRERQDAAAGLRALDTRLLESVSKPPQMCHPEAEAALHAERAALAARLGTLRDELQGDFPKYTELMALQPLPLAEVQALLTPDEALMLYSFFSPDQSYLLAIRRERAGLYRVPVPLDLLTTTVEGLRAHLDLDRIRELSELQERLPAIGLETVLYGLYLALVWPAESLLAGVRHLLLVPDGPLESLPLGILLTEPPPAQLTEFEALRRLSWLIRRYAMTVLPSVSALKALRSTAHASRAPKPFLGIGDPLLRAVEAEESGAGLRQADVGRLQRARGPAEVADAVRQLPSLPDTAKELEWLYLSLEGSPEDLWRREQATVFRVRTANLRAYRVLAFATHALVSNELAGLCHEPALVLTPPAVGSDEDDGLLRASDIAKLELDAEWVILSCCNTAASDGTPGAEGLSGIAKAFLYAGARTLLVSHWAVNSQAATLLTTGMLSELEEHPEIGRAEALQRVMLALIDGPPEPDPEESADSAYLAHPALWAPFIVVGEGGRWPPAGEGTGGGAEQCP